MMVGGLQTVVHYRLKKAPNPAEIFWSNIGVTAWRTLLSRIGTYSLTLLIICISLLVLLSLKFVQRELTKDEQESSV